MTKRQGNLTLDGRECAPLSRRSDEEIRAQADENLGGAGGIASVDPLAPVERCAGDEEAYVLVWMSVSAWDF